MIFMTIRRSIFNEAKLNVILFRNCTDKFRFYGFKNFEFVTLSLAPI